MLSIRERKLDEAGSLHRFSRDVAESLSRIQEKTSTLPEDLGRNVHSVESLIRKHEGFENDLIALEAQLQVFTYQVRIKIVVETSLMKRVIYKESYYFKRPYDPDRMEVLIDYTESKI